MRKKIQTGQQIICIASTGLAKIICVIQCITLCYAVGEYIVQNG